MIDIPRALINSYKRGQVLLFIGPGINGSLEKNLSERLAAGLPHAPTAKMSLAEVAQEYESAWNRPALVSQVIDFYTHSSQVNFGHQLLAAATQADVFVTVCIDELIEAAFAQAGRRLNVVVDHVDRAYSLERGVARLFKLHGTISRPETLQLTARNIQELYYGSRGLSPQLSGYLAEYTNLFLGFDLEDPFFQQFYSSSIAPLDRHARTSYTIGGPYSRRVELFCQNNNIQAELYSLTDFLSPLLASIADSAPAPAGDQAPQKIVIDRRPFKKLFAYQAEDTDLFFGRQPESEQLLSLVHAHRLVVLHGSSGSGKSSLLGAGLQPGLTKSGYQPLLFKVRQDLPLDEQIRQELGAVFPAAPNLEPGLPLVEYLLRLTRFSGPLVVMLDQFEDFFIHHTAARQQAFVYSLAQAATRSDLPVKWLFSLRSEWFSALSELRPALPDIFKAEMRVEPMSDQPARLAIQAPLEQVGMHIDPVLVGQLLADLGPEVIQLPQLQLTCDQLYDEARRQGKTIVDLQSYEAIGGAQTVLIGYLNRFLQRFPPDESLRVRIVLMALITAYNTLAQRSLAELVEITGQPQAVVERILSELETERLVLAIERPIEAVVYQLVHYYLVDTLTQDPRFLTEKAVREMLHQETANWQHFGTLLDPDRLNFLREQLGEVKPSELQRELILRSALRSETDLDFWACQLQIDDRCLGILREQFEPGKPRYPRAAVQVIASLPAPASFESLLMEVALDATRPRQLRRAAAVQLVRLFPQDLELLRRHKDRAAREIVIDLFLAQEAGEVRLSSRQTWRERLRMVATRLIQNSDYILRMAVVAGMFGGGIGGFLAGLLLVFAIPQATWYYVFVSTFTSVFFGLFILGGMSVLETALANRSWFVCSMGGALGGALSGSLIGVTNVDHPTQQMLITIALGSLTGWTLVSTFNMVETAWPGRRRFSRLLCLGLAGFMLGLIAGVLLMIGLPGLQAWHVGVMIGGGWIGMGLGMEFSGQKLAKRIEASG